MSAGDHGEPPEGGTGGAARPGGAEPEGSPDENRFEELSECLSRIGGPGAKAREFLETARQQLRSDAPSAPKRGELVAYCIRQAADSILEPEGSSPEDQRWKKLSRKAVAAYREYERALLFSADDSDVALTAARAAIDALDEFHNGGRKRSERQATATHARLTGSIAVRPGLEPVRDFLNAREKAASRLHSACSVGDAERLLSECVEAMIAFLRSTDDKSGELAERAGRTSPGTADLEGARQLIINDSDLEVFLGSVADPAWLVLLYQDGRLNLPAGRGGWWAARAAAIRLSGTHRPQVKAWLVSVAAEDRRDSARGGAVADVLLSMAEPEFDAALKIAARHPRDRGILRLFMRALEGADPSDQIVERCADIFLNALIPEGQTEGQPAGPGWNRMSGDMIALVRMLADGANEHNANSRIRLLLHKMAKMPARYATRRLFPIDKDQRLPISTLAEIDPDEHYSEQARTVGGYLVGIVAKAMGWLPSAELLELAENAPKQLGGRLRTWILAAAPDADPDSLVAEIEDAIGSRSPNCDDIALLDRIAQELGPDGPTDRYRASIGRPAERGRGRPGPGARRPPARLVVPIPVVRPASRSGPPRRGPKRPQLPSWRTTSARRRPGTTTSDWLTTPTSTSEPGGCSPRSAQSISETSAPEQAAAEIAAWRRQPHDWGHGYQPLAQTLQQVVGENPDVWLAEPLPIARRLRHPTYISAYLQGAAKARRRQPGCLRGCAGRRAGRRDDHGPTGAVAGRASRRQQPTATRLRRRLVIRPPGRHRFGRIAAGLRHRPRRPKRRRVGLPRRRNPHKPPNLRGGPGRRRLRR